VAVSLRGQVPPLACRGLVTLLRKEQVRDAHFDVIGFTENSSSDLFWCFPAEARDVRRFPLAIGIAAKVRIGMSPHAGPVLCRRLGARRWRDRGSGIASMRPAPVPESGCERRCYASP